MARQVVSYDDLDAPLGTSLQTTLANTSANPISGVAKQLTTENSTAAASPPTKKRRRDEVNGEGSGPRNIENNFNDVREGSEIISGNASKLSSSQSLPPKPPVKKRGKHKRRSGGGPGARLAGMSSETAFEEDVSVATQHWDDPGAQADRISYDEEVGGEVVGTGDNRDEGDCEGGQGGEGVMDVEEIEDDDDDDDDETKELTHEEVWDDSALIAAWDAATEEYEAMHGKNKRWKKERVHKSPLWYNTPPEKPATSSTKGKARAKRDVSGISSAAEGRSHEISGAKDEDAVSSVPLNFETYVPTHDASLAFPVPPSPPPVPETTQAHLRSITSHYATQNESGDAAMSLNLAPLGAAGLSADEAFSRAIGAMYWCGYWTAVYHVHRAHEQGPTDNLEVEDPGQVHEEEETELLVSTQR